MDQHRGQNLKANFRLAYRLRRRIDKQDLEALKALDVLVFVTRFKMTCWAWKAFLDRQKVDPLTVPLADRRRILHG